MMVLHLCKTRKNRLYLCRFLFGFVRKFAKDTNKNAFLSLLFSSLFLRIFGSSVERKKYFFGLCFFSLKIEMCLKVGNFIRKEV